MAGNPTPTDDDVLCALAEDIADGCQAHEVAIGIKQNTEVVVRAAITGVTNGKAAVGAAKVNVVMKYEEHAAADAAGAEVIANCRRRLAKLFGNVFNAQWEEAGFPDGSTGVPATLDKRFALLGALQAYFTNHPTAESADMEATAASCGAAHTAVSNARTALNNAKSGQSSALVAGQALNKTLRKRVRGLIDELGTLLTEDDVRYLDFGLNVPASPVAPQAILDLTLTAIGGGKVLAEWTYAVRMEGTRVLVKENVPGAEYASAGTVNGLEMTLKELTPGATYFVKVIPYNEAGDGPESPEKSIVVT